MNRFRRNGRDKSRQTLRVTAIGLSGLLTAVAMPAAVIADDTIFFPIPTADSSAVWAQRDGDAGGVSVPDATGYKELNSISIDVEKDGFLVISGQVFINFGTATYIIFYFNPRVDGVDVQPGMFATRSTEVNDLGNLSYTVTVPITKGAHTISHVFGPKAGEPATTYFHNREYLTVRYYAAGRVDTVNSVPNKAANEIRSGALNSDGESIN